MDFNYKRVARFELMSWRAHHECKKWKLIYSLLRFQMAFYLIGPVRVLKMLGFLRKGIKAHDVEDWETAVKELGQYYKILKEVKGFAFDPSDVAKLEIGWWRIHDELANNPDKSKLKDQLARLYAEISGTSPDDTRKAAEFRTKATVAHDKAEEKGIDAETSEKYWTEAGEYLEEFYREVHKVIN